MAMRSTDAVMVRWAPGHPGVFVAGLRGPAATDDVVVPALDGLRRDEQTKASTVAFADDIVHERGEGPVSPRDLRPRSDLRLQHDDLVT